MRIGILCHASLGGSARIATELAIGLAKFGHQVHLFTRTVPFGKWDSSNGVTVHTIVPEWNNKEHPARLYAQWTEKEMNSLVTRVANVAIREKLEVINFHYAVPFAEAALQVKRRLEKNSPILVGTLHGTDVSNFGMNPKFKTRLSKILKQMDTLTTVSNNYAHLSREVFDLDRLPTVIPNFVDLTRFNGQLPNRNPPEESQIPRIVHISNFRPVKNPESMARIFSGIRKKINAELWLIGDGAEMESCQEIFREHGVSNDVHCWGLQRDVPPILAQTDLLLMTSRNESFSLVALEAMACGVPVLSTNVGGIPEVVINGHTGALFDPDDEETAINFGIEILSNRGQHKKMKTAALNHAHTFGWEEMIPRYASLYRELRFQRASSLIPTARYTNYGVSPSIAM